MNVAVKRENTDVQADKALCFEWAESLNSEQQEALFGVMNLVLERETTIGFPAPLSWSEGMRLMADLSNAVKSGSKRLMLLRRQTDKAILGQLILTPSNLPNCRHVAEISRVFVHPDFRGFTVLSGGMREIVAECERLGIEMLTLDVRANTRIHKLWEGLGFESMGIMPDYARVNGESLPGCYMYQSVNKLKERIQTIAQSVKSK